MFLDEKVSYLGIVQVVEECCAAHRAELVASPSLEEIVHFDQWARDWVKETVNKRAAVAV